MKLLAEDVEGHHLEGAGGDDGYRHSYSYVDGEGCGNGVGYLSGNGYGDGLDRYGWGDGYSYSSYECWKP